MNVSFFGPFMHDDRSKTTKYTIKHIFVDMQHRKYVWVKHKTNEVVKKKEIRDKKKKK